VITELVGSTVAVQFVLPPLADFDADLFLWDIVPDPGTFAGINPEDNWRHFFFVDSTDVDRARKVIPSEKGNILLKPVTRVALRAFLTNACEQVSDVQARSIEALRGDRDELLQCLMQANLKLQEYDHDRTRFLARAVHDFRAPLTAISGYCALLLAEDLGNLTTEQRQVMERMHHSAKKLSQMASAMFQLSIAPRIEASLDLQPGDIRECVDQALHEIMPFAQDKRLTICSNALPTLEPVWFDRTKIEQVLVNLLDNACKFTPRGGTIDVSGYPYFWSRDSAATPGRESKPNSYRIEIRDSGPGISPAHLATIFEEYTSYGGGSDRSGGGLGLAVCRMILNQHKGRIWAKSTGGETVFSFVLPTNPASAHDHDTARAASIGIS
jgi:signal transduction histidine kinase